MNLTLPISTFTIFSVDGPDATPDNPAVRKSLSAMLTAYVARKLSKEAPHEVCIRHILPRSDNVLTGQQFLFKVLINLTSELSYSFPNLFTFHWDSL